MLDADMRVIYSEIAKTIRIRVKESNIRFSENSLRFASTLKDFSHHDTSLRQKKCESQTTNLSFTYHRENIAAKAEMNVTSNIDKEIRIPVKIEFPQIDTPSH